MSSKIYTKTGDAGETSLVGGERVSKTDRRIDLYGEVDELNSRMGVVASLISSETNLNRSYKFLLEIQNNLFNLGSNLACEFEQRSKFKLPVIDSNLIQKMENEIDFMNTVLPELKNFILPGGSMAAAHTHLCRTSCRRVERLLWDYHKNTQEELPQNAEKFLNRLSDYFFVLARYLNHFNQIIDNEWKK